MNTNTILWSAVQICGECGEGAFYVARNVNTGEIYAAMCHECGHEHPMDPWNLGEGEEFGYDSEGRLIVTAYDVNAGE